MRGRIPAILRYGIGLAVVAALIVLQPLTAETYQKLFDFKSDQLLQPPVPENYPVPACLVWRDGTRDFITRIGSLPVAAVLGIEIALFLAGLYIILRALNPTFRMTTGVDWDQKLLTHTYMHTPPLIKAFLIGVTAFLPMFLVWHLIAFALGDHWWTLWLRLVIAGAVMWLLFSRDGVAGDYESGNYEYPRDPAVRNDILLRGALYGTVLWVMLRFAPVCKPDWMLHLYRAMGGIGEAEWWSIVRLNMGFAAAWGFVLGSAAVALGRKAPAQAQLRQAVMPLVLLVLTVWFGAFYLPSYYRDRYDYDPTRKTNPTARFVTLARVPDASPERQTILLVLPDRAVPLVSDSKTSEKVAGTTAAASAAEAFWKRRGYQTSLSYAAFTISHDTASLMWNPVENLRLSFDNATRHCPDPAFLPLFVDKLQFVAVTPEVVRYADMLADGGAFYFRERESRVLMGDIYARLGQRERALKWYQKAELPGQQGPTRFEQRGRFVQGKISGHLMLDGKPLANTTVGVMGAQAAASGPRMAQATGIVPPSWLWGMSAATKTDAQGRFSMDHLVDFAYGLVVRLPGTAPSNADYEVANGPAAIFIRRDQPSVDLGTIEISSPGATPPIHPARPASPPRSGRSPGA